MRRPRIRIRTLMLIVAAVGLGIGGGIEVMRESRLAASYRDRSLGHGLMENSEIFRRDLAQKSLAETDRIHFQFVREAQEKHDRFMATIRGKGAIEVDVDELHIKSMKKIERLYNDRKKDLKTSYQRSELLRKYHESLRIKYDHAARHPWLPVASDPPEPDH